MSYILDALKKSEAERQQQQSPGFASTPGQSQNRGAPRWIWLLGVLLLVNVAVLAALLLRPDSRNTAATISVPTAATTASRASPSFSDIVRDARQATPAGDAAPSTARSTSPETLRTSQPQAASNPPPGSTPRETRSTPTRAALLPTFMELRANGELQTLPLHLDIHVYSDTPADRFVFINMHKYRENATLEEGPQVVEINADGVILEQGGSRFLLPRE